MRRLAALALVVLGFGGFLLGQTAPATASGHHATLITIDGTIDELAARHLSRGLDEARDRGARLVIVRLDTPGGLYSSTRDMVESLLTSPIPVAVYVSPPGAQAASAGTFIVAAAHVAAMAPGTNIGAATPIAGSGRGPARNPEVQGLPGCRRLHPQHCRRARPKPRDPRTDRPERTIPLSIRGARAQRHRPDCRPTFPTSWRR